VGTEQYGLRKGVSIENAACRLKDSASKCNNQKMHVERVLCDLAKAWDCGNHEMLLVKLHLYGI